MVEGEVNKPFCNTWPWPNSDLDLVNEKDNDVCHKIRGCCDGWIEYPKQTKVKNGC